MSCRFPTFLCSPTTPCPSTLLPSLCAHLPLPVLLHYSPPFVLTYHSLSFYTTPLPLCSPTTPCPSTLLPSLCAHLPLPVLLHYSPPFVLIYHSLSFYTTPLPLCLPPVVALFSTHPPLRVCSCSGLNISLCRYFPP